MQHTLQDQIVFKGIGLHSGHEVTMTLVPAPADHGVVFSRIDISPQAALIPARFDHVVDTRLCTVIADQDGHRVGTIEHIMAALHACGIDNVRVDIDGEEVPIMDGSSKEFVAAIEQVGRQTLAAPRRAIRILKTVEVVEGDKVARLSPSSLPRYRGKIDFAHPDIGVQNYDITLVNGNFKHDLADCRTFGFLPEIEALRQAGLARGGSLDNAIVLDDNGILNQEGLRCSDEFIRHKLLDAIGDIYLAGGMVLGLYEGERAGHDMNNKLLHALFADQTAWEFYDLFTELEAESSALYAPSVVLNEKTDCISV